MSDYRPPVITDHGTLTDLTRGIDLLELRQFATLGVAFAASVIGNPPIGNPPIDLPDPPAFVPDTTTPSDAGGSAPLDPITTSGADPADPVASSGGVPGGDPTTPGSGSTPTPGASPDTDPTATPTGSGGGGAADLSGVASGASGSLPFTGYALALVAGAGMTLAAAGAAMRRLARR